MIRLCTELWIAVDTPPTVIHNPTHSAEKSTFTSRDGLYQIVIITLTAARGGLPSYRIPTLLGARKGAQPVRSQLGGADQGN